MSRAPAISLLRRYFLQEQEQGVTELVLAHRPPLSPQKPSGRLEEFRSQICNCSRCPLAKTRKNFVFGEGHSRAGLVFVGEAPGHDEDLQGRPFVGAAGQLLTKIIEAIKLDRSQVYICNILKCRPPNNRNPLPAEIEQCEPYLVRQLELIRPRVICALGTFAAQTLLKTKLPISKLRGQTHFYQNIKLVPTFHPAALLRNPGWKRQTWEDVQLVRKIYDQELNDARSK
jgi:DNA polymerase